MDQTIFLTKVRTEAGKQAARLLIESLCDFGGEMSRCPIWLFEADPQGAPCRDLESAVVRVIPLELPAHLQGYLFGDKVYACARAEALAAADVHSLVWIDPSCLVVNPPLLYRLGEGLDAGVRPVHIRNIGLLASDPLDSYWKVIYKSVGVEDIQASVESFVDRQRLRAYFNTHAFAINPAIGLLHRWLECFEELAYNRPFQSGACQDELHRIFLHQAIFSALIAASLNPDRLRILPPEYNYPYNLHPSVPSERRAGALNNLVSFTYEDRTLSPAVVEDIQIREPLRSWLASRFELC